jgi:hypothetical protein
VPASGDNEDDCGEHDGMQGKPKFSEKTCPSATFVHHKIPRAHPGLNPGRRGGIDSDYQDCTVLIYIRTQQFNPKSLFSFIIQSKNSNSLV